MCCGFGSALGPAARASRSGTSERPPDVDQIVRDHAEADPAFHSFHAAVAAAAQSMPPLEYADAAFAAGSPTLRLLEPAALLQFLALRTVVLRFGTATHLTPLLLNCPFLRLRIEARIGGDQSRHAPEFALVRFHRRTAAVRGRWAVPRRPHNA